MSAKTGSCLDCSGAITNISLRCKSCARKYEWSMGVRVPSPTSHPPLLASRVRNMPDVQSAWIGALIEGEGHIRQDGRGLIVEMVEVEPISTLLRFTGCGSVEYYPARSIRHQDRWRWSVRRRREVQDILRQVHPFLAAKQELALRLLEDKYVNS